jgi:predicted flap endonuclease-1-like 5' DNA nuclease
MFENLIPDMVLPAAGFVVGALITFLYSQRKINERDEQIQELEDTLEDQEKKSKTLNKDLKKNKDTVTDLNEELSQRDETIESLNAQIAERNVSINTLTEEKEDLDSRTRKELAERDETIQELEHTLETRDSEITGLNERVRGMESELAKRDETIGSLEDQLEERHVHVKALVGDIADLGEKNRESLNRAEGAESRIVELENDKQDRDDEITRLKAKQRAMIDDFTKIDGIGPKVSAVLRFSGIKTFSKLASADVAELREILEAENPSLLRLTDPSTWSEQARMAAEGEWEDLEALQESLKESRRRERTMLQSPDTETPAIVAET